MSTEQDVTAAEPDSLFGFTVTVDGVTAGLSVERIDPQRKSYALWLNHKTSTKPLAYFRDYRSAQEAAAILEILLMCAEGNREHN
jgi:hypothetical protein